VNDQFLNLIKNTVGTFPTNKRTNEKEFTQFLFLFRLFSLSTSKNSINQNIHWKKELFSPAGGDLQFNNLH